MTDPKATASNGNENPKKPESASVALITVEPRDRDSRRSVPPEAAETATIDPPPRPLPARDAVASTLAIAASLVALLAAGGGYYLWQELVKVQQTAGRTSGVTQAQLESAQQALGANTQQTAAELRAELATAGNELTRQTQDAIAAVNTSMASLQDAVQQASGTTETKIAALEQQLTETRAASEKALLEAKAATESSLNQAAQALTAEISNSNNAIAEIKGALDELRTQLAERLTSAEQVQTQLHALVEQSQRDLTDAVSHNRMQWSVTEIEHLLSLANQQAALEQDVTSALNTLRAADERLRSLDDPGLLEVRSAVQADIAALEGTAVPDVDGTALALARLAEQSNSLPFASDRRSDTSEAAPSAANSNAPVTQAADTAWDIASGFAAAAWDRLRGVAVVRENGEVRAPVLPPEQAYFLQQNLRLQLESARLALLREDEAAFRSSVKNASEWLNRYYDTQATEVRAAIDELARLEVNSVKVDVPDISGSLRVLREAAPGLTARTS